MNAIHSFSNNDKHNNDNQNYYVNSCFNYVNNKNSSNHDVSDDNVDSNNLYLIIM